MKLVAAMPRTEPVPDEIETALGSISPDDLRDVVNRIAVPRVFGTPQNEAVRRLLIDLFTSHLGTCLVIDVDEAGNLVAGDPRRAKILVGAHYDAVAPARLGPTTTPAAWPCCSPPLKPSALVRRSATSLLMARNTGSWEVRRSLRAWDIIAWSRSTSSKWSASPATHPGPRRTRSR